MLKHSKIYLMIFLIVTFVTAFFSSINMSFSQPSTLHDNSLIAKSTDCITSMMTSTLIGLNSSCADEIDKNNYTAQYNTSSTSVSPSSTSPNNPVSPSSTSPNIFNLSKNNPFYSEFQSNNNDNNNPIVSGVTADSPNSINGDISSPYSSSTSSYSSTLVPPPDNPATFIDVKPSQAQSYQQLQQQSRVIDKSGNSYSYQSFQTSTITNKNNVDAKMNNELNHSIDGKNKHSKEISACFDRAFIIDNYLADSEIIQCAKDPNSYK